MQRVRSLHYCPQHLANQGRNQKKANRKDHADEGSPTICCHHSNRCTARATSVGTNLSCFHIHLDDLVRVCPSIHVASPLRALRASANKHLSISFVSVDDGAKATKPERATQINIARKTTRRHRNDAVFAKNRLNKEYVFGAACTLRDVSHAKRPSKAMCGPRRVTRDQRSEEESLVCYCFEHNLVPEQC